MNQEAQKRLELIKESIKNTHDAGACGGGCTYCPKVFAPVQMITMAIIQALEEEKPLTVNSGNGFEHVVDVVYCNECTQYHIILEKD